MSRILIIAYVALPVLASATYAIHPPTTAKASVSSFSQRDHACSCVIDGDCSCDVCGCATTEFVYNETPTCCAGGKCGASKLVSTGAKDKAANNSCTGACESGCDCVESSVCDRKTCDCPLGVQ